MSKSGDLENWIIPQERHLQWGKSRSVLGLYYTDHQSILSFFAFPEGRQSASGS